MENFSKKSIVGEFYELATGERYDSMISNVAPLSELISGQVHFGYNERASINDIIYFAYRKLKLFEISDSDKLYISSEYFPLSMTTEQQEHFETIVSILGSEFSKGGRTSDPDFHFNKTMLYARFDTTDDVIINKPNFNWMQKGTVGNG